MHWSVFNVCAVLALALVLFLLVLILFEPGLRYHIKPRPISNRSAEFLRLLAALCDAEPRDCEQIQVLNNGETFYPAELAAIAQARCNIHLEAYIFAPGRVSADLLEALRAKAAQGVRVKVVVDAIGSFLTRDRIFQPLRDAGGQVEWYQPLRWYTFKRWNNRTHRKLLVIDGQIAFAGGADIGDDWLYGRNGTPPWRDTVFRFDGHVVNGLQATFAENWLEASGNILADEDYFPLTRHADMTRQADKSAELDESRSEKPIALVINSAPSAARATRAHILYSTLLAYARKSIHITTPYFLPDRSSRHELQCAIRERGVEVIVLTPGKHSDHLFTRSSARSRYGALLKSGAKVYEYLPSMIHAKTMVIDGIWSVVGSTNFDNRSFGLNDEVNVAIRDLTLACRLEQDFAADLANSQEVTFEVWQSRSLKERILEPMFNIFDRQF